MRSLAHKFLKKKDWAEYYIDLFGGGSIANLPELHDYRLERVSDLLQDVANQYSVESALWSHQRIRIRMPMPTILSPRASTAL